MHECLGCSIKAIMNNNRSAWSLVVVIFISPLFSFLLSSVNDNPGKRVVGGTDRPCEGVATSLRFPSQPGSFSPSSFGSEAEPLDGQQDSPIKTSPVSERIKALEALAAKKREPDFRSDGSFTHFRDRHHEKSPTDTSKSPPEMSKSPPETPKSPLEMSKSPTEKMLPVTLKMGNSVDQESPESPFELLGDSRQTNEFEETEEWMKAHLPPVLPFDAVDLIKGADSVPLKETNMGAPDATAAFAGVPDAFMDPPVGASELKDESSGPNKQPGAEEEFDVSFLPTAYMWDQPEKPGVHTPSDLDSVISSSPAPPADFASASPPQSPPACADVKLNVSEEEKPSWIEDLEQPQASEVDSSGESDDTVIEDSVSAPLSALPPSSNSSTSNDPTTNPPSTVTDPSAAEMVTPPPKSERKLMQVPTINVIETDEPNYSEEEMEIEPEVEEDDYIVKDPVRDAPKTSEPEGSATETPQTRPLETEFMEGYSPPSSPVDSDVESSPIHSIVNSGHEQSPLECGSKPEPTVSVVSPSDFSQVQADTLNEVDDDLSSFLVRNEEVDFPDNDDEWADEVQDILVKPGKSDLSSKELVPDGPPKVDGKSSTTGKEAYMERSPISITSFMQDEIYDRQSFDYDYDISSSLDHGDKGLGNAKERFLSDPSQNDVPKDRSYLDSAISLNNNDDSSKSSQEEYPQNPYSCFQAEIISSSSEQEFIKNMPKNIAADSMKDDNTVPSPKGCSDIQQETKAGLNATDIISSPDRINSDASVSEPTDSFVEFMRECLKSRQDEEPGNIHQTVSYKDEMSKTAFPSSQISPSLVMDLEQEKLTISALKELGSSQDEECVKLQVSDQNRVEPSVTPIQPTSITAVPNPPCPQSNRVFDGTYSQEVEVIEEWVAEAYHLAEHVLTAILTHLSGNISSLWAVGLLTSCTPLSGILFSQLHLPSF